MSEKTEKPTTKKLRDLKEKGDVIKSEEVVSAVQSIFIFTYLYLYGNSFLSEIIELINTSIESINYELSYSAGKITGMALDLSIKYILPLVAVIFIGDILSIVSQIGFVFAVEKIKPSLQKLSVKNNIKNIFSLKNVFELLKSILKLAFISLVSYIIIREHVRDFSNLPYASNTVAFDYSFYIISLLWKGILVGYLIFSIFDFWFQRRNGEKKIMMTKDEVKRESKDSDGNPEVKSERKKIHAEIQSGSLGNNVRKSTVIVKNPTHIAVCIYYKLGETPVPQILEIGIGKLALHILKIAEDNNIPIVEEISLARGIHANIAPGDYITEDFFEPVAEILRIAMNLDY
ncbi:EscU/YscU/HrcU family type III secretion system export apparatus switch protein [Edwardsiella anguillarum]|uniref:EscU/YscU/HrcU family type III secretion system export apparatus switch protein n=1 Tax=Edwardsiella anguillarum TaxID=1821960 RepID=UPI0024B6554B|nr:EscU/YscU/HrcU family type III secretion system export apparatus switch protein [Edwardsiella anguillarum]WHP79962.1 EscU/YscU/HrcU family type III secretion system export apparatus switch protein [Edwardsiella anguillarum]WHQ17422.1 EscU/YscU/HrcU family type III secretion system export apparatus switch protein [Edwardsiella anguillarum]WHQ20959.1 EscU/YscU/HrcU family type III secretion system export apparatus switch protein [Edwardsiella anguillarum]WHQ24482.1 EscU/YscU/HrcU family type I